MVSLPEINDRMVRTLNSFKNVFDGEKYALFGSYARLVLEGENVRSPPDALSDLDIAIRATATEETSRKLIGSGSFDEVITIFDYNAWPTFSKELSIPEFRIKGEGLVPVHLVGCLELEPFNKPIVIDGISYVLTDPRLKISAK